MFVFGFLLQVFLYQSFFPPTQLSSTHPFTIGAYIGGLALLVGGSYMWAKDKGRSGTWGLLGLVAPFGFIGLARLENRAYESIYDRRAREYAKKMKRSVLWADERSIPVALQELMKTKDLPDELRQELLKAQEELQSFGAVSYPTIARVEYYLHKFQNPQRD
jgi:hypothetical protein